MHTRYVCLVLLLLALLLSPCLAEVNRSLGTQQSVLYLPFQYTFSLPAPDTKTYLVGKGYPTDVYPNGSYDDDPEYCWVDGFAGLLSNATGLLLIDTHGDPEDGSIIAEAYKTAGARNNAYNALAWW